MRAEVWSLLGAAVGSLLLACGLASPLSWVLYLLATLGLVQPSRTRSFGVGMATALLAVGAFAVVRLLLNS